MKNSSKLNGIRTIDLLPCLQDSSSMSSPSLYTQTYSCPIALIEGTLPVLLPVIEGLKGNICLFTEMKTVWMAWIPRARLFEKKNHSRHPSSWSLAPKVDQWVSRVINPAMQKTVFFVEALLSTASLNQLNWKVQFGRNSGARVRFSAFEFGAVQPQGVIKGQVQWSYRVQSAPMGTKIYPNCCSSIRRSQMYLNL